MNSLTKELKRAGEAYRQGRFDLAYGIYRKLADAGHAESQVFVGWMQLSGLGVAPNEAEAAKWFEKAAALGSTQGQFYYARYLTNISRHSEAIAPYERSAAMGYLPAVFWVGYALARGKGVAVDTRKGYRYLVRAAKRGHVHALREIAVLDLKGHRGVAWQFVAPLEFLVAVTNAFILAHLKLDSDLLRA